MTDTDDTDDLLLIPQDFFVVESDDSNTYADSVAYFSVVNSLIGKVDNLKKRIKSIESRENLLSISLETTLDRSLNQQKMDRKYSSSEDLYLSKSAQSTPQKPHNKFRLNSLPATPSTDLCSPGRSSIQGDKRLSAKLSPKSNIKTSHYTLSSKKSDMSNEIDTFLTKVKTIQRMNATRNLESEFTKSSEVDQIDKKQKNCETFGNVRENRCEVNQKTWQCGDYKDTVPDFGAGATNGLYRNGSKSSVSPQKIKIKSSADLDQYPTSDSSLEICQQTTVQHKPFKDSLIYDPLHSHAVNVLNMHKQLLDESDEKIDIRERNSREHKPKSLNTICNNLGLLSLADIWSTNSQNVHLSQSQLKQKYDEEKLRRKHCENMIQDLQTRNLEMQQKLSVAVKVDDSKNAAIVQFQEALGKIMTRMEKLNKEKQNWESEISKLKDKHKAELNEAQQRVSHQETEASKALNLAHGNQEKMSNLERQCVELQEQMAGVEKKFNHLQKEFEIQVHKNSELKDELGKSQQELYENRNTLQQARVEIAQSKRAIEICGTELTSMKSTNTKLEKELREEKEERSRLEEQRILLLDQIEQYKKTQNSMQEDLCQKKNHIESIKVELRNFYQGQLELLVQNKLKEFQDQLDKSEATFKEDIKRREMEIAKTAAYHIHQIKDKFTLEIRLLEKKHQEESNLHKIKQEQLKEQLNALQSELDRLQEKRENVAKQLQKIMEAQWSEALKIIQNGRSPTFGDETFSTIDQLNSLKVRSYNNLEEMLNDSPSDDQIIRRPFYHTVTSENFKKNAGKQVPEEDTPVSSRSAQQNKQFSEKEIQKYVNLLLNKADNKDIQDITKSVVENVTKDVRVSMKGTRKYK